MLTITYNIIGDYVKYNNITLVHLKQPVLHNVCTMRLRTLAHTHTHYCAHSASFINGADILVMRTGLRL